MGIKIIIQRGSSKPSSEWSRRLVWGAVLVALSGSAYTLFGNGGLVQVFRGRSELERLTNEVQEAQRYNDNLRKEVSALHNDPAAIEKIAREDLLLARPDEVLYLLPPLADKDTDLLQEQPVPENGH